MKLKSTILILLAGALLAPAQDEPPVNRLILPPPGQSYPELKAALNLNDTQMQSLADIDGRRRQAEQAIYAQLRDKQVALNALLSAGSTDALRIGQLMVDINNLRKQVPIKGEPYRASALNVLTPDQKARLGVLVSALQLQTPAWQAVNLNLIDAPQPSVRILPVVDAPEFEPKPDER